MSTPALRAVGVSERFAGLRVALPALLLGVAAWAILFRQEIAAAIQVWVDSTAYNHCFLIIPIALYLAWDRRNKFATAPLCPLPRIALLVVPLLLAWFAAERLGIMEGRQLAAMAMLQVMFLAVLGWRLWKGLSAPLLYLFFLIPFGAFIVPQLQSFTAWFIDRGLDLFGIVHYSDANFIQIPEGSFYVAEACAGLRFLIASVAYGVLYALLMYQSWVRRFVFIAVSTIVPVVANGFRAFGIVALGHVLGSADAAAADHVLYGWIFFSLVILVLTLLGLSFRQEPDYARPDGTGELPRPGAGGFAVATAAAISALCASGPIAVAALQSRGGIAYVSISPVLPARSGCVQENSPGTLPAGDVPYPAAGRFLCKGIPFRFRVRRFAPTSGASLVLSEQRRLASADSEGVQTVYASGPWRLTLTQEPPSLVASALWVDGKPAQPGLSTRLNLALDSLAGSSQEAVLVSLAPELAGNQASLAQAQQALIPLLENHSSLDEQFARLSTDGRDADSHR
ncbi:MAG: exosortase [Acetobacteraceae bacterium]|nr:exosortase [Acetobacteraceae bacterium]